MKHSRGNCIALAIFGLIIGPPLQAASVRYQVKIDLGTGFYATQLNNLDQTPYNFNKYQKYGATYALTVSYVFQ